MEPTNKEAVQNETVAENTEPKAIKRKPQIIHLTDEEMTDVVGGLAESGRCPPGDYMTY